MPFPKPVYFTRRVGVNFLWHMLAVARVGYDSEYAETYRETVDAATMATLQRHAAELRFGNGEAGRLTAFLTFLPGWMRLETRDGFARYFAALDRAARTGSFRNLVAEFSGLDWSDPSFEQLGRMEFPIQPNGDRALNELATAYLASFERYLEQVWPRAHAEMAERETELTKKLQQRDYIEAWENLVQRSWSTRAYEIVLCHSNANGPDYNSLGYSGNVFYFAKPFTRTRHFVSHEIGTHILSELKLAADLEGGCSPGNVYRAFEVLAMFLNQQVLLPEALAYDLPTTYRGAELMPIYANEYRDRTELGAMLVRGARYLQSEMPRGPVHADS